MHSISSAPDRHPQPGGLRTDLWWKQITDDRRMFRQPGVEVEPGDARLRWENRPDPSSPVGGVLDVTG
ncbi:MAG: hypothetical protein AB1758_37850 [Candidatus Eremiobacterota bacterium]